jgi:cytochrome P450
MEVLGQMTSFTIPVHLLRDGLEPDPGLRELRESNPLTRLQLPSGALAWLATGCGVIREVLADEKTFGNDGSRFPGRPGEPGSHAVPASTPDLHGTLTFYDPPQHGRLRSLIAPAFSRQRLKAMQPVVEAIVSDCASRMASAGSPADLVQSFSLPVPSLVICELLGVPYGDRAAFQQRSKRRFDNSIPPAARTEAARQSRAYMAALVRYQRTQPGPGLIGDIMREHGDEISDRELAGLGDILLLGGYETTAHMLSLGTMQLLRDRSQWELIGQGAGVDGIVEELLRYISVVQTGVPRVALRDVELSGQQIRAGERVICSLPSGNRDRALTDEPDTFSPARSTGGHLAFGHGIHYCVGAALARMELRIAWPALATTFPGLRLAAGPGPAFRTNAAVYGLDALPVTW